MPMQLKGEKKVFSTNSVATSRLSKQNSKTIDTSHHVQKFKAETVKTLSSIRDRRIINIMTLS